MNTRRTGIGVHEPWWCCTQSARLALSWGVSATCPSTPAVRRPALTSVTRRTLSSVFARDRSINFCRLRTFFRSPALDAVKIRCRSRRTSSSTARQSTASQSRTASSGPFAAPPTGAAASNLPIGSDPYDLVSFTGSPDPRQRPFGPGHQPVSGQLYGSHQRRNWYAAPGFLPPFDAPAFACWVIVRPLRGWAFLTVGLPATGRTATGLSCCACARHDRAGRLLYPGDGGALPAGDYSPAGTRRFPTASPYGPAGTSHLRGALSRDINGGSRNSPIIPAASPPPGPGSTLPAGLLLACGPRMERRPLGLPLEASHPAVTRDARRGGDRPSRTGPGTTPSTSAEPPTVSPTCTHAPSCRT